MTNDPYHIHGVEAFLPQDYQQKVTFCREMLKRIRATWKIRRATVFTILQNDLKVLLEELLLNLRTNMLVQLGGASPHYDRQVRQLSAKTYQR